MSPLQRIESWLQAHGTTLDLGPAASAASIAEAELALGFELPHAYRDFLLLHDGQRRERVSWLSCGGYLHSIAECVETWRQQQQFYEPSNPVVAERKHERFFGHVFHPRWLPIAGNRYWDGDNVVIDMDPAAQGKAGQLLAFVTECDVMLIGDGFDGFLARYVALIDAGALTCVPVTDQSYEHEVVPADHRVRDAYHTRWEKLFDPRQPVKKPRVKSTRK